MDSQTLALLLLLAILLPLPPFPADSYNDGVQVLRHDERE